MIKSTTNRFIFFAKKLQNILIPPYLAKIIFKIPDLFFEIFLKIFQISFFRETLQILTEYRVRILVAQIILDFKDSALVNVRILLFKRILSYKRILLLHFK